MLEVPGRPMLSAFHMLLKVERLYGAPEQNLPALLAESREYQETVSKELAEQVVAALNELLRGFHAADLRTQRTTAVDLARTDPDHLYAGLLTALLRLVFVLYAEDRDLFPRSDVWEQNYALGGLFERLRDDAALYPDTMDDRYGAWPQLLTLWRLIYSGGRHGELHLVARRGQMFDPDRFPFLEGRANALEAGQVPSVSDGVVWRVLRSLMMLHGERLSYRTLDVEQLGSVYQSVMGFTIDLTTGPSLAIKPPKRSGAAATIDLGALLASPAAKRSEWVRERTDRKLSSKIAAGVKAAKTLDEIETALADAIDTRLTAKALPAGVPVLQPTEARRRTGSHYTPRRLTAPIVAEGLRPILERLGDDATPEQILALRVLDPALGSGAFLVE
ncbi:MAG: Eco57I restriction-modification methylase domain-containing protein, partial [Vulcanimicrobiaceae bacterium]